MHARCRDDFRVGDRRPLRLPAAFRRLSSSALLSVRDPCGEGDVAVSSPMPLVHRSVRCCSRRLEAALDLIF